MSFVNKIGTFLIELKSKYNSNFYIEEDNSTFKILMDNRELSEDFKFQNDSIELLIQEFPEEALNMYFVYDHLGKMKKEDKVYDLVSDNTVFRNDNKYNSQNLTITKSKGNFDSNGQKKYKIFRLNYLLAA